MQRDGRREHQGRDELYAKSETETKKKEGNKRAR